MVYIYMGVQKNISGLWCPLLCIGVSSTPADLHYLIGYYAKIGGSLPNGLQSHGMSVNERKSKKWGHSGLLQGAVIPDESFLAVDVLVTIGQIVWTL